jgi:hypothetical protein
VTRRRLLLALGLTACVGLAGLLVWLNSRTPHINTQTFEQICPGMTVAEVEAILGVPPGDYTGGKVKIYHEEVREGVRRGNVVGPGDHYTEWVGEEIAVLVWLDDDGKVARKEWLDIRHVAPRRR